MRYTRLISNTCLFILLLTFTACVSINQDPQKAQLRVKKWEDELNQLKADPKFLKEVERVKSLPERFVSAYDEDYEPTFRSYSEVTFVTGLCHSPGDSFGSLEPLFEKTYAFFKTLKNKDPARVVHLIQKMKKLTSSFAQVGEFNDILSHRYERKTYYRYKDALNKLYELNNKNKEAYFTAIKMFDPNDIDNSIYELEDIQSSSEATHKKQKDIYHKYVNPEYTKKETKWQENFKYLQKYSYFLEEINLIKSLSKDELKSYMRKTFVKDNIYPLKPSLEEDLFKNLYPFIDALRDKNPDQAAYLVHEMVEISSLFPETQNFTQDLEEQLSNNTFYNHLKEKEEIHNKYKNMVEQFIKSHDSIKKDYLKAIKALEPNNIDENFSKFMNKFIKIRSSILNTSKEAFKSNKDYKREIFRANQAYIQNLSDNDFKSYFKQVFITKNANPSNSLEKDPLFQKAYKAINAMKDKNPNLACSFVNKMTDMVFSLIKAQKFIEEFTDILNNKNFHLNPLAKRKLYTKYKNTPEIIKNLYQSIEKKYLAILNKLNPNDADDSHRTLSFNLSDLHHSIDDINIDINCIKRSYKRDIYKLHKSMDI
ncbi:hypothetical protein [Borrelia coriaceae]|uniref:hypothetical protein n=1 Tax=Borrelia coriaceae TaxID=144 RepID=UPI0012DF1FBD|nr:hypothetical protein [Borrelia coriaceae]